MTILVPSAALAPARFLQLLQTGSAAQLEMCAAQDRDVYSSPKLAVFISLRALLVVVASKDGAGSGAEWLQWARAGYNRGLRCDK